MDMGIRKNLAAMFLKYKIPAFLITQNEDWFGCDIKEVHEDYMIILHIKGDKFGITQRIFYVDIIRFEEYKEGGKK